MKASLVILLSAVVIGSAASGSPLIIQTQSVALDPLTNRVDFTISFNRVPNLFTADDIGRQADGFQYWVFYDNKPFQIPLGPELNVLIRGVEIFVHGEMPLRSSGPPALGDPFCGGWGEIQTTIPFSLVSQTLSFSIDLTTLGDTDGKFAYRLDAYEFGGTTHSVFSGTAGPYYRVCEPNSFLLAAAGSLLLAARRKRSAGRSKSRLEEFCQARRENHLLDAG